MSIILILGRKCTLAASCAVFGESRWICAARCIKIRKEAPRALLRLGKRQTDWLTDGRQTVTLRLPLDVASVITLISAHWRWYTQVRPRAELFVISTLSPTFLVVRLGVAEMANDVTLRRARLVLGWVIVFRRAYHVDTWSVTQANSASHV